MRTKLALLAPLVLAGFACGTSTSREISTGAAAGSAALEGSHWSVKVVPDDAASKAGEKTFDDTIDFAAGRVSMSACLKFGFEASPYSATKTADGFTFRTEQSNGTGEHAMWSGESKGSSISGTLACTKPNGTKFNYKFVGVKSGG